MTDAAPAPLDVGDLLAEIAGIGRDGVRGGYSRHLFDDADLQLREWFVSTAEGLGLRVERDGNANLWAWWGDAPAEGQKAVITGSHLDSVPGGGAFDGPLGVVSALAAVSALQRSGHVPSTPLGVVVFAEEEGSRFGTACVGSQLLTGQLDATKALDMRATDGARLGDLFREQGLAEDTVGPDPDRLSRIGAFVELHVEQGAQLAPRGSALGVATTILAHGRWRFSFTGRGDHAGSTELASRHDPMLPLAALVLAARAGAEEADPAARARATVGRMQVVPGATNAIASRVDAWLDARAEHDEDVTALVAGIVELARSAAEDEGVTLEVTRESFSTRVEFDDELTGRIDRVLGGVPRIPTGAGHDSGILSPHVPTAMIFVRNREGVSHAPEENADLADCRAGADALAAVLRDLT